MTSVGTFPHEELMNLVSYAVSFSQQFKYLAA